MADPVQVVSNLDDLSARLDTASKAQFKLAAEFTTIGERYDDLFDDLLVALNDRYEEDGKRVPGEDLRNAIIRKQIREQEPELYGHHRRLRSEMIRVERRTNTLKMEVSANQSILSWLKVEASAT